MSKTCLVRYDNNKYSVIASAVGRPVEVRAYAERIELRQDGRVVGDHPRSFGRNESVFYPWHYVPVLARKPGALRNGAPFKDWVLPAGLDRVRRKLAGVDDGDRQMVAILSAVLSDGLPAVEAACLEAVRDNVHSSDVIINILARRREPAVAITIMTPEALRLRHEPVADCARYDSLRSSRVMERSEILATMVDLKLYGMKAAFDEIITTAVKRQHEPQRIVGDLLQAEIAEKQARSIKYQITIAKLPLAKDIEDFSFEGSLVNETLVRDLAGGEFLAHERNVVLVGGTGTGKTHLAWRSPGPASVTVPAAASSTSSTSSTGSKPRRGPDGKAAWPTTCLAWTSSCSTNSATCPSPSPAGSCCSISSAASTSRPPSS